MINEKPFPTNELAIIPGFSHTFIYMKRFPVWKKITTFSLPRYSFTCSLLKIYFKPLFGFTVKKKDYKNLSASVIC
jgi:hypothetical protein